MGLRNLANINTVAELVIASEPSAKTLRSAVPEVPSSYSSRRCSALHGTRGVSDNRFCLPAPEVQIL